jgi:1-acyl-sn-glycerol-3-phosphate acyltransferase
MALHVAVAGILGGGLAVGLTGLAVRWCGRCIGPKLGFWWDLVWLAARVWYRLRREGPCTVPARGPVLLVANHTCAADPLLIIAACPHRVPGFLIAREFSAVPLFRRLTDMIQCIPVRRDGQDVQATKAAVRRLREGGMLAIFIEGRIPRPGQVLPPKEGPALLALRSGATVIPVHIRGTKYSESVAWSYFQRHRARVRFGPPVALADLAGTRSRVAVREATDRIHAAIQSLAPPS